MLAAADLLLMTMIYFINIWKITDANYLPAKLFWLAFDLIIKGELTRRRIGMPFFRTKEGRKILKRMRPKQITFRFRYV